MSRPVNRCLPHAKEALRDLSGISGKLLLYIFWKGMYIARSRAENRLGKEDKDKGQSSRKEVDCAQSPKVHIWNTAQDIRCVCAWTKEGERDSILLSRCLPQGGKKGHKKTEEQKRRKEEGERQHSIVRAKKLSLDNEWTVFSSDSEPTHSSE